MTINTSFRNRMKFKVDVWWEKTNKVENELTIPNIDSILNTVKIPFRNRMKFKVDIQAPKRQIARVLPIHDTFVSEANPYMNFGTGNSILVGDNGKKYEGLLKFNLQETFPLYNPDHLIILDSKLKLTVSNTRDIKDTVLNMYEVFEGGWTETSVTWKNKPYYSNEVFSSVELSKKENEGKDNIEIFLDVQDLVLKWLENPRKNNGVLLDTNDIDNVISFFSKENYDVEVKPQLLITYIDLNSPFVTGNKYLKSSVNVWENKINNLLNELEVITKHSTSKITSEMLILNKPGDLIASLSISKDKLPCTIDLVGHHISASLGIYTKKTQRIENTLGIKGINVENELRISHSEDILNQLKVTYGKYLKGFLGINANRIVNELDTSILNALTSYLAIYEFSTIQNKLSTTYENSILNNLDLKPYSYLEDKIRISHRNSTTGEIIIPPLSNIKNKLEVYARGGNLDCDIFYGTFADLVAYLRIKPQSYLLNTLSFALVNAIDGNISTLAVRQVVNNIKYSSVKNLTNYLSYSNINYIKSVLNIVGSHMLSSVKVQPTECLDGQISIQGVTVDGDISISTKNQIKALVNLIEESKIINELKVLNEHIENMIDIYIKETNKCKNEINILAINRILATLQNQYGNNISAKINIYVDKINVVHAYLRIDNEDYEYNKKRGYGYIM